MKRILSIAVILSLVFTLGMTAYAADANLYVNGVQVTDNNADDVLGDGTVSYDYSTNTLTLNNANLTKFYQYSDFHNIYCDGPLNIELIGTNTVGGNDFGDTVGVVAASLIQAEEMLTFSGSGSLDFDMSEAYSVSGIRGMYADVFIKDDVMLTFNGGKAQSGIYWGMYVDGDVSILNNAQVEINMGVSEQESIKGIFTSYNSEGNFTIGDNAKLNISGGYADNGYAALDIAGALTFTGNSSTVVEASEVIDGGITAVSCALDFNVLNNAYIDIATADTNGSSVGVDIGDVLRMSGGKLRVMVGNSNGVVDGIEVNGNAKDAIVMSAGDIYIQTGNAETYNTALSYMSDISMTGGSIIARAGASAIGDSYGGGGYYDMNITGGAVLFAGGKAMNEGYGSVSAGTSVIGTIESPEIQFIAPGGSFGDITPPSNTVDAIASTNVSLTYNGDPVTMMAYNIGGNNYFKLRDFATMVNGSTKQFEVTWDPAASAVNLLTGVPYTSVGGEMVMAYGASVVPATKSNDEVYMGGDLQRFAAYKIDGNNYFKLRDLCKAMDIAVEWVAETSTINLNSSMPYVD